MMRRVSSLSVGAGTVCAAVRAGASRESTASCRILRSGVRPQRDHAKCARARLRAGRGEGSAIGFDFSRRAGLAEYPELMDGPCGYEELRGCLRGIARVNRLTGAYRPTLRWLGGLPRQAEALRVLDVGCGYGDMLREIHGWARRRGVAVELRGIDLNGDAVRAAREATVPGLGIEYVAGDAYAFGGEVDVVVSSLLTHHLEEAEIVRFLRWMDGRARVGWFVNDLERQRVPYELFKGLARVMGWHRFVQHDGPVSILRSFRREDWVRMCGAAGVAGWEVEAWRPARLCVGRVK